MTNQTGNTTSRGIGYAAGTHPAEKALSDIAMACDVAAAREDGQSLADFAESVKEAIAEKILELNHSIDEIDNLDLDGKDDAS